jgi:hypothetical protein
LYKTKARGDNPTRFCFSIKFLSIAFRVLK